MNAGLGGADSVVFTCAACGERFELPREMLAELGGRAPKSICCGSATRPARQPNGLDAIAAAVAANNEAEAGATREKGRPPDSTAAATVKQGKILLPPPRRKSRRGELALCLVAVTLAVITAGTLLIKLHDAASAKDLRAVLAEHVHEGDELIPGGVRVDLPRDTQPTDPAPPQPQNRESRPAGPSPAASDVAQADHGPVAAVSSAQPNAAPADPSPLGGPPPQADNADNAGAGEQQEIAPKQRPPRKWIDRVDPRDLWQRPPLPQPPRHKRRRPETIPGKPFSTIDPADLDSKWTLPESKSAPPWVDFQVSDAEKMYDGPMNLGKPVFEKEFGRIGAVVDHHGDEYRWIVRREIRKHFPNDMAVGQGFNWIELSWTKPTNRTQRDRPAIEKRRADGERDLVTAREEVARLEGLLQEKPRDTDVEKALRTARESLEILEEVAAKQRAAAALLTDDWDEWVGTVRYVHRQNGAYGPPANREDLKEQQFSIRGDHVELRDLKPISTKKSGNQGKGVRKNVQ